MSGTIEPPEIGEVEVVDAVLFTQPDPRARPAATNLFQIKGGAGVVVTVDGTEWRFPSATTAAMRRTPGVETGVLLIRANGTPVNLSYFPGAVAVAVVDNGNGWIFWFDDGQGVRVDRCSMMAAARSEIENRYLPPGGYEL